MPSDALEKKDPWMPMTVHLSDGTQRTFEFRKNGGWIGEGQFAVVDRVDLRFKHPSADRHVETLKGVVKTYKSGMEDAIPRVLEFHKKLAELGIPTWKTFAKVEGKPAIFMTDGESGENKGTIVYSQNDSLSRHRLNGGLRKTIVQIPPEGIEEGVALPERTNQEIIDEAIVQLEKLAAKGYMVHPDSWMAHFHPVKDPVTGEIDTHATLEFRIDDLDLCYRINDPTRPVKIINEHSCNIQNHLTKFSFLLAQVPRYKGTTVEQ